ncbi:MAG: hypothetical protein KKB31_00355 [Nanoarchaeota archaeon]|nr:hypothetical protein [Nanoarchaeota archaeon]
MIRIILSDWRGERIMDLVGTVDGVPSEVVCSRLDTCPYVSDQRIISEKGVIPNSYIAEVCNARSQDCHMRFG